jgi:hypothetical protein
MARDNAIFDIEAMTGRQIGPREVLAVVVPLVGTAIAVIAPLAVAINQRNRERSEEETRRRATLAILPLLALGIAAVGGLLWRNRDGIEAAARDGAATIGAKFDDLTSGAELDEREPAASAFGSS